MDLHNSRARSFSISLLVLVAVVCAQEDEPCVIKIGMHSMGGSQAYQAWNATFATYLTDELYPQLDCTFKLVSLANDTAAYYAVSNTTIDLIYTNAGMHVCLEEQYGVAAIASVINWQNSADTESYGVAILALANRTDINVLADIPGKIIQICSLSDIAGWQAQSSALQQIGIDFFAEAKEVLYYPDFTQGIRNLLDLTAEVIFVRADLLPDMAAMGQVNMAAFKVLAQVCCTTTFPGGGCTCIT